MAEAKQVRRRTLVLAWGCVFANMTFGYPIGYPFNIATVVILIILLHSLINGIKGSGRVLAISVPVILWCIVKVLVSDDLGESLKSVIQIAFMSIFLIITVGWRDRFVDRELFSRVACALLTAHAVLLVTQFILLNYFSEYVLQNLYGPFSPLGPLAGLRDLPGPYLPSVLAPLKRPNGLFSEPSVAAAYTVFALACLVPAATISHGRKLMMGTLLVAGSLATFALTGWSMVVLFGLAWVLTRRDRLTLRQLLVAVIAALLVLTAIWTFGASYLSERVSRFGEEHGSIYVRFVGPARALVEILSEYPQGLPINDPTILRSKFYLVDYAGRRFTNLDNFYFWITVYLGLPGVALIVSWFYGIGRQARKVGTNALPIIVMAMFAGATGGGYSAIFILPLSVAFSFAMTPASAGRRVLLQNPRRARPHLQAREKNAAYRQKVVRQR